MNSNKFHRILPVLFLTPVILSQPSKAESFLSVSVSLMFSYPLLISSLDRSPNNKINLNDTEYTNKSLPLPPSIASFHCLLPLPPPPACLITASSDELPKAVREANKTGYRCTLFFSGEAILDEPLEINDHHLLGLVDPSTGFSATGKVLSLQAYSMVSADRHHHFLKPDHKTTRAVAAPLSSAGFPIIRPSRNFRGSSLLVFSGKASLTNIVFAETPGIPALSEISYVGTTPESLVLTDVLWSIRYLAPYSCSNNGKASTTSAQEPVSNTPTSGSGCRSAWVNCLRFLFCCGGSVEVMMMAGINGA